MVTHKATYHDPEWPPGPGSGPAGATSWPLCRRNGAGRPLHAPSPPAPPRAPVTREGAAALRHVPSDERLGHRRAAAPRVRQPLTHLTRRPRTESGPAAAALVEPHARVQQHREGPPGRDVPPPRCRERRPHVDHRLRAARTAPLPCPVVGLLEGGAAGEADVRGLRMAHPPSLGIAPGGGHRLSSDPRQSRTTRAEAILVVAVAPPPNRLLAGAAGGARLADAFEGSRS